ncbi:MAG: sugar transferase [Saprospiraceae bacterium]|nr:sugar transferase [Saprospiraceae bacterium]
MITHTTQYLQAKRVLDILISATLLLILSPLFLVVAVLIKLESRGPIFYKSKRVGQYYKVFDFWKFRSMRTDADHLLQSARFDNQYVASTRQENTPLSTSSQILVHDTGTISESEWFLSQNDSQHTFIKIENDPRITRVGRFIRNTSIDELPQLINVLRGDMSLVGNRPLPLYEAEKLTSDEAVGRFIAPAGITGLWQVTERGKKGMSADSRKRLDVEYAKKASLTLDFWILFRTPMAALQSANV